VTFAAVSTVPSSRWPVTSIVPSLLSRTVVLPTKRYAASVSRLSVELDGGMLSGLTPSPLPFSCPASAFPVRIPRFTYGVHPR
jgi:hypothetical protein